MDEKKLVFIVHNIAKFIRDMDREQFDCHGHCYCTQLYTHFIVLIAIFFLQMFCHHHLHIHRISIPNYFVHILYIYVHYYLFISKIKQNQEEENSALFAAYCIHIIFFWYANICIYSRRHDVQR